MRTQWITLQYVAQLGMMAASAGMGMIQDIWQQKMNEKAEGRGVRNSKELMDYQNQKQLEMWEKTGYKAQVEQMKKAGINPALLYGMSGGGAQTVGGAGATAQGIGTQSALSSSMGMGIQAGLMEAQRKVLESQANLNNVEAAKKGGVDTEAGQQGITESKSRVELLAQELDNKRWQFEILKLEKALKNIEVFEKEDTLDERIDTVEYNTKIAAKQLEIINNDATISSATKDNKIKLVAIEVTQAALKNAALEAGINLTKQQESNLKAEIKLAWDKNLQAWKGLDQAGQKVAIDKFLSELKEVETWGRIATEAGGKMLDKALPQLFKNLK